MSQDDLTRLVAQRAMSDAVGDSAVDWAIAELETGADSPTLRVLAGLIKPVPWSELELHLAHAARELGYSVPDDATALRQYQLSVAAEILAGEVTPDVGCTMIFRASVALGYPPEQRAWLLLCDDLDPESYQDLDPARFDELVRRHAEALITAAAVIERPATSPNAE